MTMRNGGELAVRQLVREGIDTFFGVLAGPMLQVFAAAPGQGMTVVGCRHEEQAGFMAQAWAYVTGGTGVLVTGSGPGTANAVTSMLTAKENGWPLVALGGSVASRERGLGGFQETDQVELMSSVAKWRVQVDAVERIPELVHLATGKARAGRPGPAYVDFPAETLWLQAEPSALEPAGTELRLFPPAPHPQAVAELAALLAQAERPLVVLGKGAAWSPDAEAFRLLADLGIPFLPAPMARGLVSDDHPMCVAAARGAALAGADAVVMLGGRFNWMLPAYRRGSEAPKPRIAQVDIEPEEFYSGTNVEFGVVGDAGLAARALVDALGGESLRCGDWAEEITATARASKTALAERLRQEGGSLTNLLLWREIAGAVDDDTIVVTDGEITPAIGRMVLSSRRPRSRLDAGTTSCMGTGVPYAIGAKVAAPDRPVLAVLGDWAFGASAMEIETAARVGAPVVFVVSNNGGIAGHYVQDSLFPGDGPPIASLLRADYHHMAAMVGGHTEHVTAPDELAPALRRALDAGTVALVNVMTDPADFPLRRGSDYLTTGYSFSAKSTSGYQEGR